MSDTDVTPAEEASEIPGEGAEPMPPRRRRRRRKQEVVVAATRTEHALGEAGEADLPPPADADDDEPNRRLPPGIAAPHELARRSDRSSKVARFSVPVLMALIVVGLGAGVYAQRDQILAMISPAPPQVSSSAQSGTVSKKVTDRLGAPPESGSDDLATRPVTTTRVITPSEAEDEPGDTVADEPGDDTAAASSGASQEAGDGPTELETASVPPDASVTPDTPVTETTATVRRAESSGSPAPASSPTGEQRAILYEEGGAEGDEGAVVNGQVRWEIVNQSFGGQDPEPVVRATVDLPGRDLKASLVIRENRDDTLPASHLLEISFQSASGGASEMVANVPGLIMKEAEDARGNALVGAAARVSTGLFWIALSADPEDEQTNRRLLSDRTWIDVPILYESGQRAILTLQKGGPGERAVSQAFEAWSKG